MKPTPQHLDININRLVAKVKEERRAVGFPSRCGKISYSKDVHTLARKIILESKISIAQLSEMTDLTPSSLRIWSRSSKEFRELQIVPHHKAEELHMKKNNIKESSHKREIDHQEKVLMESENQRREKSIFHLFLPWGIKIGFEAFRSNAIRPIYMSIGEKND